MNMKDKHKNNFVKPVTQGMFPTANSLSYHISVTATTPISMSRDSSETYPCSWESSLFRQKYLHVKPLKFYLQIYTTLLHVCTILHAIFIKKSFLITTLAITKVISLRKDFSQKLKLTEIDVNPRLGKVLFTNFP